MAVQQHLTDMMDVPAKKKRQEYTVEDIYALPDGQRAELINGHWYDMATPMRIHQKIVMEISSALHDFVRSKGGDCEVYPAPFAVFLKKDNRNYLEPDVTVICDPSKLTDKGCEGAPDLVVEVTSESTKRRDYGVKLFLYRTEGVKEYWIINPDMRTINTYAFSCDDEEKEIANQISFDEPIESVLYPEFRFVLADEL